MATPSLEAILIALALTLLAGMSTGVGAMMSLFAKADSKKFLAGALGFSAGVMLYVSFLDLIPLSLEDIAEVIPGKAGEIYVTLAFFGGMAVIALIDWLIPEDENPHELNRHDEGNNKHLKRTGTMLALAIGIHNFPEGMATFVSALDGPEVALPIVIAIAIHNIPEGIAVAVPIYHATGDRKKALKWSTISGLAEPLGALVGMLFLLPFWSPTVNSLLIAAVAGVMVYISVDELLPGAENYGHHHIAIGCVILGMALMALSILMF